MARHVAAPPLETARLSLRGFAPSDLEPLLDLWADPKVHQFITGKPATRQDIWFKILRSIGHWQALGYGYWVVLDKASGRLIGEMGYGDFQRPGLPLLEGRPELGFVLAASHHGRGLALEALTAIQAWGDSHLDAAATSCIISPRNLRSIALAGKLGFTCAGMAGEPDDLVSIYLRERG